MLYLRNSFLKASPKAISGRTSYLRVRLEFHPYPQVIPAFFNRHGFGPPQNFTFASPCSWIDHSVSGLRHTTTRPFKTRFPFGSTSEKLNLAAYRNSLARSTKSTWSRIQTLPLLVNIGFQILFHSPSGVLFTFPSRYYALSVTKKYLALGGGPPCFPQGFTCLVVLWISHFQFQSFVYRTLTLYG